MTRARTLVASAAAVVLLPLSVRAQVLFMDDFDAGTSASRYDVFSLDNDGDPDFVDVMSNFAFNYGQFIYKRVDEFDEVIFEPIPPAPNSAGGTTTGLRFSVNDSAPGGSAVINAYPKASEFLNGVLPSGNYSLTFDLWMNYNGFIEGGAGSTEYMVAGINQEGGGIGGPLGTQAGVSIAVAGERGNPASYRTYQDNERLTDFVAAGYVAVEETVEGTTIRADDGRNSFYRALFPFPEFETEGAPGKNWVTVEISQIDGIITYKLNDSVIASRPLDTRDSGTILLGYADFFASLADPPEDNFVIFDNVVVTSFGQPAQPQWNVDADGDWSAGVNWQGGVPNSSTAAANFLGVITVDRTVNVDDAFTVATIRFDNERRYTLAGDGGITLSGEPGAGIQVAAGSHTIAVPITVSTAATIAVTPAESVLTLSGGLSASEAVITKSGAGAVEVPVVRAANLAIDGGTVHILPEGGQASTSVLGGLSIAEGAGLDLADNDLILRGGAIEEILALVVSGRNGGGWDGPGISSSAAASDPARITGLAAIRNEDGGGRIFTEFSGQAVDEDDIVIKYTLNGDMDFNDMVDIDDYFLIDTGFLAFQAGVIANPTYRQGDLDYNDMVDIDDYFLIDTAFLGQSRPAAVGISAVAVPEPASGLLLIVGASGLAGWRRRRHWGAGSRHGRG